MFEALEASFQSAPPRNPNQNIRFGLCHLSQDATNTYLDETNVASSFTEALTADVKVVFSDDSVLIYYGNHCISDKLSKMNTK